MAKAIRCDCCGKVIDITKGSEVVVMARGIYIVDNESSPMYMHSSSKNTTHFELCYACDTAIGELFNSRCQAAIEAEGVSESIKINLEEKENA